ncbi:MAG TPA: hypothetical protein VM867_08440 [Xanthobacteraceae bacterium]|nr:hypothetical protein [Xanthobacteraceae bacterium]
MPMQNEVEYGSLREKIAAESAVRKANGAKFEAAYNKAAAAGKAAGEAVVPRPMVVQQRAGVFGGAVVQDWFESEGLCGFAWVNVSPGNSPFANWLKKNKLARKAYAGGVDIWISAFGQSSERKEACARAMAKVLVDELGVSAYADSRLD